MRPYPRKHVAETASSLEDSAFEVISSYLGSDDEDAHTESLASTDGYTGDDILSIADTEEADEVGEQLDDEEESSGDDLGDTDTMSSRQLGYSSIIDAAAHNGLTVQASSFGDIQRNSILLQKGTPAKSAEHDICRETVQVEAFDYANMPAVFRAYRMPKLRIQRHMSRSEQMLRPSEPFRVWFFGEPEHKADILDKLGSALYMGKSFGHASSTAPDGAIRYNVTPVSSFTQDVTLLPSSGVDLYVRECAVQSVDGKKDAFPFVTVLLDDNMTIEIMPDGSVRVPGDKLKSFWFPDIAVFCHVPAHQCMEPGYAHWQMSATREAVWRLQIPVLDIYSTSALPRDTQKFAFGAKSLFMSLEGESASDQDTETLALFPIPLEQFRELDPIALNQHLECITRDANRAPLKTPGFTSLVRRMLSLPGAKSVPSRAFILSLLATLLPVLAWLVLINGVSLWQTMSLGSNNWIPSAHAPMTADLRVCKTPPVHVIQTRFEATPSTAISSPPRTVATGAPEKGLGQPLLRSLFTKSNHSTQFDIHITEDRRIAVVPPKSFQDLKKRPHVQVILSRGNHGIHVEVKELENFSLVVEVSPADASGMWNVTVQTTSKPIVNQTVEIDFGPSWLEAYVFNQVSHLSESIKNSRQLFDALQSQSEKAQSRISNVTRPLMDNVCIAAARAGQAGRAAMHSMQSRGEAATDEAKRLGYSALAAASDAAGVVADQLQALAAHATSENILKAWRSASSPLKSGLVAEARKKAMSFSERLKRPAWTASKDEKDGCHKADRGTKQESRRGCKSNKRAKGTLWN